MVDYTDLLFLAMDFCGGWDFAFLSGLALTLAILMTFGALMRAGLDFVAFGALEILGLCVGEGFPPGQLLKT